MAKAEVQLAEAPLLPKNAVRSTDEQQPDRVSCHAVALAASCGCQSPPRAPTRRRPPPPAATRRRSTPPAPQDILHWAGYCSPISRRLLFWALCLLSGGVVYVLSRWYLRLRIALTLVPCPLGRADLVVVTVRRPVPSDCC